MTRVSNNPIRALRSAHSSDTAKYLGLLYVQTYASIEPTSTAQTRQVNTQTKRVLSSQAD